MSRCEILRRLRARAAAQIFVHGRVLPSFNDFLNAYPNQLVWSDRHDATLSRILPDFFQAAEESESAVWEFFHRAYDMFMQSHAVDIPKLIEDEPHWDYLDPDDSVLLYQRLTFVAVQSYYRTNAHQTSPNDVFLRVSKFPLALPLPEWRDNTAFLGGELNNPFAVGPSSIPLIRTLAFLVCHPPLPPCNNGSLQPPHPPAHPNKPKGVTFVPTLPGITFEPPDAEYHSDILPHKSLAHPSYSESPFSPVDALTPSSHDSRSQLPSALPITPSQLASATPLSPDGLAVRHALVPKCPKAPRLTSCRSSTGKRRRKVVAGAETNDYPSWVTGKCKRARLS